MSTLKVNKIEATGTTDGGIEIDSDGHVQLDGVQLPSAGPLSNRNLIINGAMQVAQRGTEVTGVSTADYRTCDRFRNTISNLGTWTIQQSAESPDGFANSLRMLCTTADASPAADDYNFITYKAEGFDCQRLINTGTTTHPIRLSFWVKSNRTGDASVDFIQKDNSNRMFSTSYNIAAADTWEHKVIEIPSDTAAAFDNDNGQGLEIDWWLNSGSTYTGGTHSAGWVTYSATARNSTNLGVGQAVDDEFFLTGVQLEVGSAATPFEHRSYGDELRRCERYYQKYGAIFGWICHNNATTQAFGGMTLRTPMRVGPSSDGIIAYDDSLVNYYSNGVARTLTSLGLNVSSTNFIQLALNGSGFTAGGAGHLDANSVDAIKLTAEL